MKKIILFILSVIGMLVEVRACDICGCGVGNSYIGILPEFNKHIFGIRYRYNSLLTHVGVDGTTTYLTTDETYRTAEAWGGWDIGKFRLMASLPYNFNERLNQGSTTKKNGIGDISVSGFYQLINSRKAVLTNKLLVQSLWLGGSVKLPTGDYNPLDKSATNENANLFQLGTGSVDFSVNGMYDIRLQDVGVNLAASYKMNTTNKYEYSYGNKFSTNAQVYYKFRIKNIVTIAPNTGILYENAEKDLDHEMSVDISGGRLLMGTVGVEASVKKIAIGGNWQTPLSQNLADGIVKANNRMMLHVAFAF
ncbi:transporter [Danxiaibacter flavus]|uniref:Transporter n=1 Tax=Danxiaibacter flavus TaxID=3049108 RepID=A0ABV3ZF42_9BACT|nr:transporter [Chitinophagaceae bacterium DXS]